MSESNLVATRTSRAAFWVLLGIVAALFAIRVYAAAYTIPVRTWDDVQFRRVVDGISPFFAERVGFGASVLPPSPSTSLIVEGRRAGAYLLWLLTARALLPSIEPERAYQLVNVVALALEALLVYALFRKRSRELGVAAAALYVSMPFVFGVNRWVWTDNHVMLALLALSWACTWLAEERRQWRVGEIAAALAAGLICGLAAETREYAAPSIVVLPAATVIALLLSRRFAAAAAFVAALAPYLVVFVSDVQGIALTATVKAADTRYYHSVLELFLHSGRHVVGPTLAVLIAVGMSFALLVAYRLVRRGRAAALQPVAVLLFAHLAVAAMYGLLLVVSTNRISRGAVPIVWTFIGTIATALRSDVPFLQHFTMHARRTLAAGVAAALLVLGYDLFVAFDGGRTYAAHAFLLGTFNHPLWLPEPSGPGAMHVTTP